MSTPAESSYADSQFRPHAVHGCYWGWCRLNFPTNAELNHHVINEHVRTAIPVKRSDLAMLRRAEEGMGDSLGFSGLDLRYPDGSQESHTGEGEGTFYKFFKLTPLLYILFSLT